jgi:4-diphosphocytidyl-2-C-methyl-D-erythritol kinase
MQRINFMAEEKQIEISGKGLKVLAPAKINLTLLVAGQRADGYHNIETIMAKLGWYDEIFLERAGKKGIELICKGRWSPEGEENLVYKAWRLIKEEAGIKEDVRIILTKNIPSGTGLGSGSSDAAATLIGVNKLLGLGMSRAKLGKMAIRLGSDVPFFLDGPLAFCTGRGEKIKKFKEKFNFLAVLALSNVSVSTKMVYENYKHNDKVYKDLKRQINQFVGKKRIDLAAKICANMLLTSCLDLNERLLDLKERIESLTGERLCLSGSGSSMFYILRKGQEKKAEEIRGKISEIKGCECIILKNNRW